MKALMKKVFILIAVITMALSMTACDLFGDATPDGSGGSGGKTSSSDKDNDEDWEDPTEKDYDNGIYFEEENEDYEVKTKKVGSEKYLGSWEATSGQSLYQFGNVDLKIKSNHTWTGNVSDEDLKGKWTEQGDGIYLTSELFNFYLYFTKDDTLIMQYQPDEEDPDDVITTVLTKKYSL